MSIVKFNEARFKQQVDRALDRIRKVLDVNRRPKLPAEVEHEYPDKYILAQYLSNMTLASVLTVLQTIGVTSEHLKKMCKWAKTRSVSLRLKAKEDCTFLRKEIREVKSPVHETSLLGLIRKDYTITKYEDYYYRFDQQFELVAYQGSAYDDALIIAEQKGSVEVVVVNSETPPRRETLIRPNLDCNITWFLSQIGSDSKMMFSIDRSSKHCRTPRRNPQTNASIDQFATLYRFAADVHSYFVSDLFPADTTHSYPTSIIHAGDIFCPVIPIFEKIQQNTQEALKSLPILIDELGSGVVLVYDVNPMLKEQEQSIQSKVSRINSSFASPGLVVTSLAAKIATMMLYIKTLIDHHADGMDYIEDMLRKQIIAAIGKELQPHDFTNYMLYHNRKLFKKEYQPIPFSHAIRRPKHYPEGFVDIEAQLADGRIPDPIYTMCSYSVASRPMKFALDAANHVSFMGDRFLHGWVSHQFSGDSGLNLSLFARARQFSSFIVMVGRIASADSFDPKYAFIVKNKDELKLPLLLDTLPTPAEFRDAIESLSPEQQRFAKAFRSMQLESTLFGVLVLHIKPQLEKVLKLPDDALTKEMKLSELLLNLFLEYQIPSDLLSYDGPEDAHVTEKVNVVRKFATEMQNMIKNAKEEALAAAKASLNYEIAVNDDLYMKEKQKGAIVKRKMKKEFDKKDKSTKSSARRSSFSKPGAVASAPPQISPPTVETSASPEFAPEPSSDPNLSQTLSPCGDEEQTGVDYTKIPSLLDSRFEELDEDGALRPTIINPGNIWTKKSYASLLSDVTESTLSVDDQTKEKARAFDLLDCLTRSGALTVDQASLHVVLAATHCFDKTLLETLVQDNVNPIEKVERSSLIVGSTIHNLPALELVAPAQLDRVQTYSPMLITDTQSS